MAGESKSGMHKSPVRWGSDVSVGRNVQDTGCNARGARTLWLLLANAPEPAATGEAAGAAAAGAAAAGSTCSSSFDASSSAPAPHFT